MKKLIITLLSILSFNLLAQQKDINWMHGMEGNHHTMDLWANRYQSMYNAENHNRGTYSTRNGIRQSAVNMNNVLVDRGPEMILVAQSLGGVVARQLHRTNRNTFGGLITLGSPHAGVPIADFVASDDINRLSVDLIEKGMAVPDMLVGKAASLRNMLRIPKLLYSTLKHGKGAEIKNYKDLYKDWKENVLADFATGIFGSTVVRDELNTNSNIINELQEYNMNIPMIAIWGDEKYPYFLRNASSAFHNMHNGYNLPLGGIKEDIHESVIQAFKSANQSIKSASDILRFTHALYFVLFNQISNKAKTSIDYFNGPLQSSLDDMAGEWTTVTQTSRIWIPNACSGGGANLSRSVSRYRIIHGDCGGEWRNITTTKKVRMKNDGVVPRDYAIALPGVHPDCIIRAENVNHEELNNSTVMDEIFRNRIFNGEVADDRNRNFFRLKTR